MWKRLKEEGGVILADDMGLGKTLQVRGQASTCSFVGILVRQWDSRTIVILVLLCCSLHPFHIGYFGHICLLEILRGP